MVELPLTAENVESVFDEIRPYLIFDGCNVAMHEDGERGGRRALEISLSSNNGNGLGGGGSLFSSPYLIVVVESELSPSSDHYFRFVSQSIAPISSIFRAT